MKRIAILLTLITGVACAQTPGENPVPASGGAIIYAEPEDGATPARPDFRAALDAHFSAIAARDLAAYENTITTGEELWVIFPNGERVESRADVVAFHKEWFADKNWIMRPELMKIIEGEDMAMALYTYAYRDTPDGDPRSSWLMLLFKLEGGEWRLVHDQNTRIADPEIMTEE